jgi:hypothetical protein
MFANNRFQQVMLTRLTRRKRGGDLIVQFGQW